MIVEARLRIKLSKIHKYIKSLPFVLNSKDFFEMYAHMQKVNFTFKLPVTSFTGSSRVHNWHNCHCYKTTQEYNHQPKVLPFAL